MLKMIIDHLLGHRRLHLLWLSIVTALFAASIAGLEVGDRTLFTGLQVDNSMDVWFNKDNATYGAYKNFQEQFDNDEFVVVAFRAKDIFKSEVLRRIADLTEMMADLPYVRDVKSLTNVEHFQGIDGTLSISRLISEIPEDPLELARIREAVKKNRFYKGNLISEDGTVAGILVRLETHPKGVNYCRRFSDALTELLDRERKEGGYEIYVAGLPMFVAAQDEACTHDAFTKEVPLAGVLLILVLFIFYRRFAYVGIALLLVAFANIWTYGLMAMIGSSLNMMTLILCTLITVIGVADAVHFISEYNAGPRNKQNSLVAVRHTFLLIIVPCLFTSLTTAAGFMSMGISETKAVSEFGLYAAAAMIMTFVINAVLVPICLTFFKKSPENISQGRAEIILGKYLNWVADINNKHVKVNIAIAIGIFLISLTGVARIEVNSQPNKFFPEDHPLLIAAQFIEDNLSGTSPFEIVLQGPEDSFKDPAILKRVDEFQKHIETRQQVTISLSLADILKEINRAIHDGDPAYYRIPETRAQVAQLMLLAEGSEEMNSYLDMTSLSVTRIHCRFILLSLAEMNAIMTGVERKAKELFKGTEVTAELTGHLSLTVEMIHNIVESQVKGFSLALVAIFIMFTILVRSVRLGLIGMVPNLIPIFLTLGIMGWTRIYLDSLTVTIASVAIGLAVDDTIHFLSRFKLLFEKYRNYETATDEAIRTVGRPLTITSMVLFFGFGSLMVSSFLPTVYYGMLLAITMVSALVGDLFVLPALIKVFKPLGPEQRIDISATS